MVAERAVSIRLLYGLGLEAGERGSGLGLDVAGDRPQPSGEVQGMGVEHDAGSRDQHPRAFHMPALEASALFHHFLLTPVLAGNVGPQGQVPGPVWEAA